MHRVGQNVHSEFSIGCHRRTWMNILANPTLGWQKAPERWRRCTLWTFWCFSELLPRDSLPRSRLSTQDRTCHTNAGENSGNPGQANAHKCLVTIWLLLGLYVFWWCCFCLVAKLCLILCKSKDCSTPGFPVLHCLRSLLKLMFIESVMPSNHLVLCRPLLPLSTIFPSIRVFSNELALSIGWPKYWSFSISPFNEYSGLISFGTDWFDLLAVQGTLKS